MIHTSDGTTIKRVGGKPGDRSPTQGFKRDVAVYKATGGEASIDLSALSPAINYQPGQEQIRVLRSSMPGDLWSGRDYSESSPTSIEFLNGALLAGEEVKIIKEFAVVGVKAADIRPDAYSETASASQILVTANFSWPYNLNQGVGIGAVAVYLNGILQRRDVDYTEVNLGSGFTNQIAFVDALSGGENIIMFPTYMQIDQSAAQTAFANTQLGSVQSLLSVGTQPFVDESERVAVPATDIVNRAKIPNLANDLRASMAVDRLIANTGVELFTESGSSGQRVYGALGDDRGLVRFVGGGWFPQTNSYGTYFSTSTAGDYVEITFYGTGLNILQAFNGGANITVAAYVDGTLAKSDILGTAIGSSVISGRNYATNQVVQVAKDLPLGIHTIKLLVTAYNGSQNLNVYGFEVINQSSLINVNPGTAYINGQKRSALAAKSLGYKTTFENINDGSVGTRGGRAIVYIKPDGSIAKAFTPVDTGTKTFSGYTGTSGYVAGSVDHSSEEAVRVYNWREFGAGRSDDFSTLPLNTLADRFFTLDDGTTTLMGNDVIWAYIGSTAGIRASGAGAFYTLTFIGTGLDVLIGDNDANTRNTAISIDGISVGTYTQTASEKAKIVKICSGLPYGTHTVRFAQSGSFDSIFAINFVVYAPKKPTLPADAVELGDYNVMADFSPVQAVRSLGVASGVLRKYWTREFTYVNGTGGTMDWTVLGPITSYDLLWFSETTRASAYLEYTFFGTGFDLQWVGHTNRTTSATISVDGLTFNSANFGSIATNAGVYANGSAFNATTGVLNMTAPSDSPGYHLYANGLPLGVHKIRITNNNASQYLNVTAIDAITPIHALKDAKISLQGATAIGSCSVSDSRKTTPIKVSDTVPPGYGIAVGVTATPTVSATSYVPMPEMNIRFKASGKRAVRIDFGAGLYDSSAGNNVQLAIFVNGKQESVNFWSDPTVAGQPYHTQGHCIVMLPEGVHTITGMWKAGGGTTISCVGTERLITAYEI